MDDLGVRHPRVHFAGHAVVKACADGDQQIALGNGVVGVRRAVHSEHPQRQGVGFRERAQALQRGRDRRVGHFGQRPNFLMRSRINRAAADIQQGPLGFADQLRRTLDLTRVAFHGRLEAGDGHFFDRRVVKLSAEDVLGNVYQHRSGPSRPGDMERFGNDAGQLFHVFDQPVVLGDRHGDAGDVGFLERIGADEICLDLARDGDNRHRVHHGVGNGRDQVRRARSRSRKADADFAGGERIAFGHMARTLLVAHQNMLDVRELVERVIQRDDGPAGITKDRINAFALEAF